MDISDIAKRISQVDELETWNQLFPDIDRDLRKEAISLAEMLWVQRMANEGRLLVHPDVLKDLESQHWRPNDLQKRMIWASVLADSDKAKSKDRFVLVKERLIAKYNRDWWEDIYRRIKPAYAAKQRIIKNSDSYGPAVSVMAKSTILIGSAVAEERIKALKMIPKD